MASVWAGLTFPHKTVLSLPRQDGLTLQEKVLAAPLAWAFDLTKASRDWSVVPAKLLAFSNVME